MTVRGPDFSPSALHKESLGQNDKIGSFVSADLPMAPSAAKSAVKLKLKKQTQSFGLRLPPGRKWMSKQKNRKII